MEIILLIEIDTITLKNFINIFRDGVEDPLDGNRMVTQQLDQVIPLIIKFWHGLRT